MEAYLERISRVETHLNSKDYDLGFRLLLDCVLDTQNNVFYKRAIQLAQTYYDTSQSKEVFKEQADQTLERLKAHPIFNSYTGQVLLEVCDVQKQYKNFTLKDVSFKISQGDIWGLVGENGNGKTTLLRILSSDLHYTSGKVEYTFTNNASHYDLRTELVFIPQRTPKSYGKILQNLKFVAAQYGIKGETNDLLTQMYILRFGLWPYRNMKWSELSSGYKMRFELAKTLLRCPKILILDEPLANLDVLTQQTVLEDLKNISQSLSNPLGVILSSQQLFEVEKIANHILFLKNGTPTNVGEENEKGESKMLVVELDINCTKQDLVHVVTNLEFKDVEYNGGTFIIKTSHGSFKSLIKDLSECPYEVTYIRDISNSSRRLFTK